MAKFQVKKAVREEVCVKIALMAPSGGGKTYGSLRLATGMADETEKISGTRPKIVMINTEGKRGLYYADEFDYDIIDLDAPYEPELFIDAINYVVAEYDKPIIILDSTSHEWEGKGGCLEIHKRAGGRYQDWDKVTPRHDAFINAIADCPTHVIATMRGKDQYSMDKDESSGKTKVEKLAVGAKQRDGFEYEFTCTFLIDQPTSTSTAMKDNTHIFENKGAVKLSETHGEDLIKWANSGTPYTPPTRLMAKSLEDYKNEIVTIAKKLGGSKNEEMMKIIKEYVVDGNTNKITNAKEASELLDKLKEFEGENK